MFLITFLLVNGCLYRKFCIDGGDLQQSITDGKNTQGHFVCKKRCYPRLKKLEKMSSAVKTLEGELKEEILRNNAARVRIKRGLSREYEEQKVGKSRKSLFHKAPFQQQENAPQYAASSQVKPAVVPVFMQPLPQCFTSVVFSVIPQENTLVQDISGDSKKLPENNIQRLDVHSMGSATENNEHATSQAVINSLLCRYCKFAIFKRHHLTKKH